MVYSRERGKKVVILIKKPEYILWRGKEVNENKSLK